MEGGGRRERGSVGWWAAPRFASRLSVGNAWPGRLVPDL